ncbi:NAD(P)H-dependent oxidoreductase subunit E [Pseudonocardia endophytica]|uniref:Formate dehydrogenase gamma subunit n=1 Tax=Pseudonocardia endophytica TaxID=401976 RepID=A0A4R1HV09_PSEEN|nr:NAD(P)H-dependent oxidoreductase subunit E [Pseudonocardia endophytica]TCK21292.1 formate dehydrogenase gamma subunit [Pseudonocardia endophytica]
MPDRPDAAASESRVRDLIDRHRDARGPLLPILHEVQREFGRVDDTALDVVARELNLSRAEVHGVVSFYTDFRREPAGSTVLRVCRGEACQAVGAEELYGAARGWEDRSSGDAGIALTVEEVFCFGNCALGPTVEMDGVLHGRTDVARLDDLLAGAVSTRTGAA